jgi:catechol 2,3-dioxygenase-like lactoylglutathione lyase family enzyme
MIRLNLVVIRTINLEKTVQWYSQTFDLVFVDEKHEDGVLHFSAKLNEGLIEIYPTKNSAAKITFGFAIDKAKFEKIIVNENPKIIDENTCLIRDFDGNSLILNSSD